MKTNFKKATEVLAQVDSLIDRMFQSGDTGGAEVLRDVRALLGDMTQDLRQTMNDMREEMFQLAANAALQRVGINATDIKPDN